MELSGEEEMRSDEVGQAKAGEENDKDEVEKALLGRKVKCDLVKQFGSRVRQGKQSAFRSILIGLMEAKIIGKI